MEVRLLLHPPPPMFCRRLWGPHPQLLLQVRVPHFPPPSVRRTEAFAGLETKGRVYDSAEFCSAFGEGVNGREHRRQVWLCPPG